MKTLVLLSNRIKQFAVKNKLIFVLFIIIGLINSITFAYLYGNLRPALRNYYSTEYYYRKYEVYFTWADGSQIQAGSFRVTDPDKNYVSEKDIDELINTDLFEAIVIDSSYRQSSLPRPSDNNDAQANEAQESDNINTNEDSQTSENGGKKKVAGTTIEEDGQIIYVIPGNSPPDIDENGRFVVGEDWEPPKPVYEELPFDIPPQPSGPLSEQGRSYDAQTITSGGSDVSESPNQPQKEDGTFESICTCVYGDPVFVVIDNGTGEFTSADQAVMHDSSFASVGETVKIRGEEFKIIGRSGDLQGSYLIPYEKYKELEPYNNHMILVSKDRWHLNNDVPLQVLSDMYPDAKITSLRGEVSDKIYSDRNMPMIITAFVITMISFAILLDHLTSMLSEENAVSLTVGAAPSDITSMAILEGVLLSVLTIAAGLLLHYLLYAPLLSKLDAVVLRYRAVDYLEMFLYMTAAAILIMIVRSVKYLRLSPQKLRNNGQ